MLLALSVVLGLIESVIPFFNGTIPGLKLGLANIIVLLVIHAYGFKDAMYVSVLRVILMGILRTGIFSVPFFFSLGGALLSVCVMYVAHKFTKLSLVGVSILGSISHSIGQIVVAMVFINTVNMIYYLPCLLLFSVPTGIVTGIICNYFSKTLEKQLKG